MMDARLPVIARSRFVATKQSLAAREPESGDCFAQYARNDSLEKSIECDVKNYSQQEQT